MAELRYNRSSNKNKNNINYTNKKFPYLTKCDIPKIVVSELPAIPTDIIPEISDNENSAEMSSDKLIQSGIDRKKFLQDDSENPKDKIETKEEDASGDKKDEDNKKISPPRKFTIHNLRFSADGRKSMAIPLCKFCDKIFQNKGSLSLHMRTHTGYKPHVCKDCGKAFSQVGALQQHVRLHTGVRPYKCTTCSKDFAQLNGLHQHVRIHSGEQPYQCSVCHKRFSQNGSLKCHMRTHSGDKPYICVECGKGFSQNGSLIAHRRTHSYDKPYKCELCPKMFTQKIGLQNHQKTSHNIDPKFSGSLDSGSTKEQNNKMSIGTSTNNTNNGLDEDNTNVLEQTDS